MAKPALVVFDLDQTMWPYWVNENMNPPYVLSNEQPCDVIKEGKASFPESTKVLKQLKRNGLTIAVASRLSDPALAMKMIRYLKWDQYFTYIVIRGCEKKEHFKVLRAMSGVSYDEMVFFDDEWKNRHEAEKLGAVTCAVDHGMDVDTLHRGLALYIERRQTTDYAAVN